MTKTVTRRPMRKSHTSKFLTSVLLGNLIAITSSFRLYASPVVLKASFSNVRNDRAVMIPMRDGKRLSADIFRPDAEGRFPAIVMYHPYRKDDVGRGGVGEHYYFAERGFVSVRLDARGTGNSEGLHTHEDRL